MCPACTLEKCKQCLYLRKQRLHTIVTRFHGSVGVCAPTRGSNSWRVVLARSSSHGPVHEASIPGMKGGPQQKSHHVTTSQAICGALAVCSNKHQQSYITLGMYGFLHWTFDMDFFQHDY